MLAATFQTVNLFEIMYALVGLGAFIFTLGFIAFNIVRKIFNQSAQRRATMQSEERITQMNVHWDVNWGG